MRGFWKFMDNHFEECIVLTLLLFLVLSTNFEVFKRYILNASGNYSEEIARFVAVWIVYLGVPYAIRHKKHIVCDILPQTMSHKWNLIITTISYCLFVLFSLLFLIGAFNLMDLQMTTGKRTEAMHIPMYYVTSVTFFSAALSLIRLFQLIRWELRDYKLKTSPAAI